VVRPVVGGLWGVVVICQPPNGRWTGTRCVVRRIATSREGKVVAAGGGIVVLTLLCGGRTNGVLGSLV
jgi:hypothetical protein